MSSTLRIKLDDATQERLKSAASGLDRAPHWVIKTALIEFLEREEVDLRERQEDECETAWKTFQITGVSVSGMTVTLSSDRCVTANATVSYRRISINKSGCYWTRKRP